MAWQIHYVAPGSLPDKLGGAGATFVVLLELVAETLSGGGNSDAGVYS